MRSPSLLHGSLVLICLALSACVPEPPRYPAYDDRDALIAEAQAWSDALEAHIAGWMDGDRPAEVPDFLLPRGMNRRELGEARLVDPATLKAEEFWGIREAGPIDMTKAQGYFPDPHCTYMIIPALLVPFGSKVVVEGSFPHCRYFGIQMTASLDPDAHRYEAFGLGEVAIADVDIDPLPGHVNPFRVGANRRATKRDYRVTFETAIGNPAEIEPAFKPLHRGPGNTRKAGALLYRGPWGTDTEHGDGRGKWMTGELWIRYYAPDLDKGSLAGVPLPRVHYELPDGRRYFIKIDHADLVKRMNRKVPVGWSWPQDPPAHLGPRVGWYKQMGIGRAIFSGVAQATKLRDEAYIRELDKGVAGRGEDLPPPGNYEASATCCNHINYLVRGMNLGYEKVVVLTGRLPTTPKTRKGNRIMTAAEARYWSLTAYDTSFPHSDGYCGAAVHSVMDEDVVTDARGHYVIALSRAADRPANATADNGVTWLDWGPRSQLSWTLRWLSVHPEWSFEHTPDEIRLGWQADWASRAFDPELLSRNTHEGFLKEYQPKVHVLTRKEFEELGRRVRWSEVPVWSR